MIFVKKYKDSIVIEDISEENEDSYSMARIKERHLKLLGVGCLPWTVKSYNYSYEKFIKYINDCNRFVSSTVPNKHVKSDVVKGTSKLNRHPSEGFIELTRRYVRKDGTVNMTVTSPNVCFISDAQKFQFFKDLKNQGSSILKYNSTHDRTVIRSGTEAYSYWSKVMDNEYARLSGIEVQKRKPELSMNYELEEYNVWWKLIGDVGRILFTCNNCVAEFDYLLDMYNKYNKLKSFFTITCCDDCNDQYEPIIYDIDGRFVDYASWFCKRSFYEILKKLSIEQLSTFKEIIERYFKSVSNKYKNKKKV